VDGGTNCSPDGHPPFTDWPSPGAMVTATGEGISMLDVLGRLATAAALAIATVTLAHSLSHATTDEAQCVLGLLTGASGSLLVVTVGSALLATVGLVRRGLRGPAVAARR
jgi:hypothetical protein